VRPAARLLAFLALWCCAAIAAPSIAPPSVAARGYVLVDALSGQTLAAAAESEKLEPGSLTKLMTAYVVFEAIRDGRLALDRRVNTSANAARAPGARMFLSPGQAATIAELLQGLIVLSANDAAVALAEAAATTEGAFVERMNARARELRLTCTNFVNATGEPVPGHRSCARDLATLSLALVRDFPPHYALYSQRDLVWNGMKPGIGYFSRKQGNPQMPAFGLNPNTGQAEQGVPDKGATSMLAPEQVWAVITYERNLSNDSTVKTPVAGTSESPTFAGEK